jgi:hypothetical protein
MRAWAFAVVLAVAGCHGGKLQLRPIAETAPLPVSALWVDFQKNEEGRLTFTLDVPAGASRTVNTVTWELYVGSLRFATGVEGPMKGQALGDGTLRLEVDAPLAYRHVTWVEGSTFIDVSLSAAVEFSAPSVTVDTFAGRKEVLAHGKPLLDQATE